MTATTTRNGPGPVSRRKVVRTVVLGGSAVAMGGLVMGTPAHADHAEGAVTGVLDTTDWRVCNMTGAFGISELSKDTAIALWNNSSELNVVDACTSNNVYWFAQWSPESWYGATICAAWHSGGDCAAKQITMNTRRLDAAADPTWQWKKTACHEMGHVGGLGHRDGEPGSCMASGAAPPIVAYPDDHDYAAIEDTYPR